MIQHAFFLTVTAALPQITAGPQPARARAEPAPARVDPTPAGTSRATVGTSGAIMFQPRSPEMGCTPEDVAYTPYSPSLSPPDSDRLVIDTDNELDELDQQTQPGEQISFDVREQAMNKIRAIFSSEDPGCIFSSEGSVQAPPSYYEALKLGRAKQLIYMDL